MGNCFKNTKPKPIFKQCVFCNIVTAHTEVITDLNYFDRVDSKDHICVTCIKNKLKITDMNTVVKKEKQNDYMKHTILLTHENLHQKVFRVHTKRFHVFHPRNYYKCIICSCYFHRGYMLIYNKRIHVPKHYVYGKMNLFTKSECESSDRYYTCSKKCAFKCITYWPHLLLEYEEI